MKRKLLFIIPTIKHGGAELFLLRLCSMAQRDYEIVLVVIGEREGLFREFESLDIKVHYMCFKSVIYFPIAVFKLRGLLKKERPEIVQSFLYLADVLSAIATLQLQIRRRVWSLRGTDLASGTSFHKKAIQRIAAFLSRFVPDVIISCSNQVHAFHTSIGYPPSKMVTIGNFVSSWALQANSKSIFLKNPAPIHFVIGLAARYELGKGHHALLDTSLSFLRQNPGLSITLTFAGKGCDPGGRLSKEFNKILLNESSHFQRLNIVTAGLLNGPDLANWFQSLDLYFMASDSLEGFPNSLAEAVSIGLPSLGNPVGASRDFLSQARVSHGNSSSSMTELLDRFYREDLNSKRKLTSLARERILSEYQETKILSAYVQIWEGS